MALSGKSEALKYVPWFSLTEWHRVYKQIYSNDTSEQTKAYETLLVWKARIAKLPVGVECTLSIIQVCLRDREWTPKIDRGELPMYYENDLCLMYSTTIMRFLNQISNIGHTKQTSLFQIAKQLRIPEWIVNLRHNAAHGDELPAIGSLRMAANILLTWLHEEYWAAESKAVEERFEKSIDMSDAEESCEAQALVVFIQLWIAVGLYTKANFKSVRDLPDAELRDTLLNLCTVLPESPVEVMDEVTTDCSKSFRNDNNYPLSDTQSILFTEISTLMSKNKSIRNIEDIVMKILFDSEAFFPSPEIIAIFIEKGESAVNWKKTQLPDGMMDFWQRFIALLHEKNLLEELICRLIELVNSTHEDSSKRLMASLWIKSLCQALSKLTIIQSVTQEMEHSLDDKEKRVASKQMMQRVRVRVNKIYPELSGVMSLNNTSNIPAFIKDINFATHLLLNANVFTTKFIRAILDLVTPPLNPKRKDDLLMLLRIHTNAEIPKKYNFTDNENRTYSVEDLANISNGYRQQDRDNQFHERGVSPRWFLPELADRTIRNTKWEKVSGDYDWASCAFGILPWQRESLQMPEPIVAVQRKPTIISQVPTIVPGLVDNKNLTMKSRVNWDNVLRKKKRFKRNLQSGESDIMIDRAIEMVKKRQM